MARVDGETYSLFGVPKPVDGVQSASLQIAEYTATHTIFTLEAGSAQFILDFFSPVSLQDLVRQSLPFSYLTISASRSNGTKPVVQVYSDIDNSWTGQFGNTVQTGWSYAHSSHGTDVFTLTPGGTALFTEVNDMAQWGSAVYCTQPSASNISLAVGDMAAVHSDFAANGSLSIGWDWRPGSVVAYSHDLGSVGNAHNITFTIGYARDADVDYMGNSRSGHWRSAVPDINAACVRALLDYPRANSESHELDSEISGAATDVAGSKYSDIVSLPLRQAFGAMDITILSDTLDTNDFMPSSKKSQVTAMSTPSMS
jgi:hypothetical protein